MGDVEGYEGIIHTLNVYRSQCCELFAAKILREIDQCTSTHQSTMSATGPSQHTAEVISLLHDLKNAFWLPPYAVRLITLLLSRRLLTQHGATLTIKHPLYPCFQTDRVKSVVEKMVALFGESLAMQRCACPCREGPIASPLFLILRSNWSCLWAVGQG